MTVSTNLKNNLVKVALGRVPGRCGSGQRHMRCGLSGCIAHCLGQV